MALLSGASMKFQIKVGSIEVTKARIEVHDVAIGTESGKKHVTLLIAVAIIAVVLGFFAVAAYAAVSGDYVIFDKIIGFFSTAVDAAKEIWGHKYDGSS